MISGENLMHALNHPSVGKNLFPEQIYAQAQRFDAHPDKDGNLLAAYHDTIRREFPSDPAARAASLSLSRSSNALLALDRDESAHQVADEHHEQASRLFANLQSADAATIVKAIVEKEKDVDRLFAFRQLLPDDANTHNSAALRALIPVIPHLPKAVQAEETANVFKRVGSLQQIDAQAHEQTLVGIAHDLHRSLEEADATQPAKAEPAHRPIAAHLVQQLAQLDNGLRMIRTFNAVHPVAARIDDGLVHDGFLPLLEPRAVGVLKSSEAAADEFTKYVPSGGIGGRAAEHPFSSPVVHQLHRFKVASQRHGRADLIRKLVMADPRLLRAWQLRFGATGLREEKTLAEIVREQPVPPREALPTAASIQELSQLLQARRTPPGPAPLRLAAFQHSSMLPANAQMRESIGTPRHVDKKSLSLYLHRAAIDVDE